MIGFQMFFFGMVLLSVVPIMFTLKKEKIDMSNIPDLMKKINPSEIAFIQFSMKNAIFCIICGIVLMVFGI